MNIKHGSSWRFFSTKSLGISHWLAFSIVLMLPMYCLALFFSHSCSCTTLRTIHVEPTKPKRGCCRLPQKVFVMITEAQSRQVVPRNIANRECVGPQTWKLSERTLMLRRYPSFFPTHVKEGKWLSQWKMRKSLGREDMLKPPQIVRIHVGWRVSLPSLFFSWHIFFHEDVCTLSQDLPGPAVNKTDGLISQKSFGKWEEFNQYPEKHQIFLPLLKKNSIFKLEKVNFLN